MTSEIWGKWTRDIPPVKGAVATDRGWEIPLKGTDPIDNLVEVIVATGGLATAAGSANIQSVTILTAPGTFLELDTIDIEVVFNENVDVTGVPRLTLTLDSGPAFADYASGTGTNTLIFTYTVGISDLAVAGPVAVPPIDLNGGTILDNIDAIASALTYTAPDLSAHFVDAVEPTVLSVISPENATHQITGAVININVTMSEPTIVTGVPQIPMFFANGITPLNGNLGQADYVSGSGTTVLNFQYIVTLTDIEAIGIKIGADMTLNGGTLADSAGNQAILTFLQTATTLTLN